MFHGGVFSKRAPLAAKALDLTIEELKTIYRIQFPVLRQNENDTWYDQRGRIVFTCSKGFIGVGFSRPHWEQIKDMKKGTVERTVTDDTSCHSCLSPFLFHW